LPAARNVKVRKFQELKRKKGAAASDIRKKEGSDYSRERKEVTKQPRKILSKTEPKAVKNFREGQGKKASSEKGVVFVMIGQKKFRGKKEQGGKVWGKTIRKKIYHLTGKHFDARRSCPHYKMGSVWAGLLERGGKKRTTGKGGNTRGTLQRW